MIGYRSLKSIPAMRWMRGQVHRRRFLREHGHFGVFAGFAEARSSLPPTPEFDDPAFAEEYSAQRMGRIFPYDYPVIFWLDRAIRSGARSIYDIGGSVGVHFASYAKYMDYPPDLRWQVAEVPALVKAGRDLHAGETRLAFTEALAPEEVEADVWISAGALQYVDGGMPASLVGRCPHPPRHLLLNKMPVYEGEDFVTTENIGHGRFAPHHVYNRERLVGGMRARGYELVDSWGVPERRLTIPMHPSRSIRSYSGFYFRLAA
jgi:putative methyltransferase (TIGR04325 family)